jgi:hypothetical protein
VLQERVLDLEAAMIALEAGSEQRCAEATAAASALIESVNAEKRVIQSSLYAAQADISTANQLKLQVCKVHNYCQKNSFYIPFFSWT